MTETEMKILSEQEVAEIESRPLCDLFVTPNVLLTGSERDALCQTVRALQRRIEHFETPYGEGVCRFCGNLRQAPQGHIQKCYCIPTIRQYIAENTVLRDQLAQVQSENERLASQLKEWQEDKDMKAGYL